MDHAATSTDSNVDTQYIRDYASDFETTRTFKSQDELTTYARDVGRLKDFVIVTLRSDSGAGKKRPSVTLSCERSGKWDKRSSHKKTKKCDCPFRLKGMKEDEWMLTVVDGRHNHKEGQAKEGHSFAGKLSKEEKSLLKRKTSERGVQPKEILTELKRNNKHRKSTLRAIYNGRQRLRVLREFEDYNLRLQQFMHKASEYNYIEKHRVIPKTDTLLEYFCTHPTSLEWLSAFPRVLWIEVYHQDWSGWMLRLNIFGITSTHIKFLVAFAMLSLKHKSDWGWALSTLRGAMDDKGVAMPDVIIVSEIGFDWDSSTLPILKRLTKDIEDVFSPAKLLFSKLYMLDHVRDYNWRRISGIQGQLSFEREWDLLVESPTEAEYDEQLKRLHTEYSMYPQALASVTNTWLKPYKEKFVAAWTNNIMHFGCTADTINYYPRDVPYITIYKWSAVEIDEVEIDKFWKDMDASHENVHKRIEASFVESLTNETNEDEEYRELRGVVSITALRKIREQTMLVDKSYHSVCSCAIKRTHGLPCAHEIAKYRTEGRPIPLDCIHPHWKKLDLKPLTRTAESGVDKMMKMNNSTPSAPLLSQIVESQQRNSPNAGLSIVHSNQERQTEVENKVYHNQSTKPLEFIDICPLVLRPYILDVKDVARDGHCGFRAVASLVGYSDEIGWLKVREDLRNEVMFNSAHYAQLFGSDQRVYELLDALAYSESTCPEKKHWMTMPDMGHIIASCYKVVLMHLSSVQCFTFFPLRIAPILVPSPKEIVVGFVNEHFVQVFLIPGHPMPPTVPALTKKYKNMPQDEEPVLERIHQQCFKEWATPYNCRMDTFKTLQPKVVVSQEKPTVHDIDHVPSVDNMDAFFGLLQFPGV